MTESDRQDGNAPDQSTESDVILLAAVLDEVDEQDPALPPLPEPEDMIVPEALIEAPLEVAAGPGTPAGNGGGSSQYSSDFGELIVGLQASGDNGSEQGSATPQGFFGTAFTEDDTFVPLPTAAAPAAAPFIFVPPSNPVGPGADQALFTRKADSIDFNGIDVGGYLDGTQYDAGKGHDLVVLPSTPRESLEAGFTTGSLFQAGNGNDTVTGGSLADLVDGGRGRDLLNGGGNDDSLSGGSGRDTLDGGLGNDWLDGGSSHDSLSGGANDDSLSGGNGRDTLDGGSGNDLVEGGGGHDLLEGGPGDDTLDGGANNDTLTGGTGNDVLNGGNGKDVFAYTLSTNEGQDLILDFKAGNGGDRLEIADLVDLNGDSVIDLADLDAGGHSVTGSADAIVVTFESGTSVTLDGLNGTGIDSFADLVADAKVNVDIL